MKSVPHDPTFITSNNLAITYSTPFTFLDFINGGYGGPRGSFSGGRRGGYSNGDAGEGDRDRTRRPLERRSRTGRGTEMKREGSGRGNWGMHTDELAQVTEEVGNEDEKNLSVEKPLGEEDAAENVEKEGTKEENEEKPEDKW
ncbi:RGG repeats nuclear RNA binding protein A-like [Salvia splendens]|uniref:RGG repeats nuclear RNA binding protein A-like n=1 Tax=Salvia splendens TaxID=180675 RepID=UPI001C25A39B|nr:RGG repeats nuclear RNA binding protein A-like [Salvia splendens]